MNSDPISTKCRSAIDHRLVHHLSATQEPDVELAAGEQHLVQCVAEIGRLKRRAAIPNDARLRHASHQLLDEGGADALRSPRGFADDRMAERKSLAVEPDQLVAAGFIRQWNLDRLID